jgi:serine/threonine protein kinase
MAALVTNDEFLELVRKSGLVDQERLETFFRLRPNPPGVPTEPKKLASLLVRKGFLTYFQAAQLLRGKWRGFTIGQYKVLERISPGFSSDLFLAEHLATHRLEAIRPLPFVKALDPPTLARLYQEAQAAALEHPNIIRPHEMGCEGPLNFLIVDYIDGSSLGQVVRKRGPLDIARAAHYIRQAAMGLQYLHAAGLVHRDIEPENILVDRQGTVTVLDLGLARLLHDQKHLLTKECAEKYVLGAAGYLAPEQATNRHEVDIRTDIYSLGATFYFLLTGHPPLEDEPTVSQPVLPLVKEPVPVRALRPEVPEELAAVVGKMLARDPAQRYPTAEAVVATLALWTQTPVPAPAEEEMPRLSPVARQRGVLAGNGSPTTSAPREESPPPPEAPTPALPSEAADDSTDFALGPLVSDDEDAEAAPQVPEPTPTMPQRRPGRPAAAPKPRPDHTLAGSRQPRRISVAVAAVAAVILACTGVYTLVKSGAGKRAAWEGYLDDVNEEGISGWAWNASQPDTPVQVDVYDGLTLLATVLADEQRDDLVPMGKGNGKHGFGCPTPAGLKDGRLHVVRVWIHGSKYQLSESPKKIILRAR